MNEQTNHEEREGRAPGPAEPGEERTAPDPAAPRRFRRSDDRLLFGVAGGLGRYFGVDPSIVRVAFAVSVFFGGLGVLAYLGLALFTPAEEGDGSRRAPRLPGGVRGAIIVLLLGLAGLVLFVVLAAAGFLAAVVGGGWVLAAVIGLLGAGLIALALRGRGRWLAIPLVALVVGGLAGAAVDIDVDGGIGEQRVRPLAAAEIPRDGYRQGIGELRIDLRDLAWNGKRPLELTASIGIGYLEVLVPDDVCVTGEATIGFGEGRLAGSRSDGVDQRLTAPAPAEAAGRVLVVDAEVEMGELRIGGASGSDGWPDDSEAVARNLRACGG